MVKKLDLAVANVYWDMLWEMSTEGSTFAVEANEVKHRVINGESYVEIFASVHQSPTDPFEVTLKTLTTNRLRTKHGHFR